MATEAVERTGAFVKTGITYGVKIVRLGVIRPIGITQENQMQRVLFLILLVFSASLLGCRQTARDVWTEGLSRCASDDVLEKSKLLYLGPSNIYGPGSGWRVTDDGNFEPRWDLLAAVKDQNKRKELLIEGKDANCSTESKEEIVIHANVLLNAGTIPLTGQARADLEASKSSTVKVTTWRLDRINELEYERWLKSLDSGDYGKDILEKEPRRRRVMKSAVLVKGFQAEFVYDGNSSAQLDARYPLDQTVSIGGTLNARRTARDTLSVSSNADFYIVGSLLQVDDGVFGMTGTEPSNKRVLSNDVLTIPTGARTVSPSK